MKASKVVLAVVAVSSVVLVGEASAASLLTVADTAAITSGWTDLKDTVISLISSSWAPMLGVAAVMMGPSIVKGMFRTATGK